MRTIYLRIEKNNLIRKIAIDMAFLAKHNVIRLPKYYYEEGLFFPYKDIKNDSSIKNYSLSKDKIFKEDNDFYYYKFPFKMKQVLEFAF
jgi:hypothetical protein